MNRQKFFDHVRNHVYGGRIERQSVIDGLNAILDEGQRLGWSSPWLAYLMATVYHETAHTFAAIEEFGKGRGRRYGQPAGPYGHVYFGRGWPQLTWWENYVKQGKKLGVALERDPDLMLTTAISTRVTFGGMEDGDFTGQALKHYLNDTTQDFVNARRIINGTDRMHQIARYADHFLDALIAAEAAPVPPPRPKPTPANNPDTQKDAAGGAGAAGGGGTAAGGPQVLEPGLADIALWVGVGVALASLAFLAWQHRTALRARLGVLIADLKAKGK